jgi:hypothetical protein
MTVTNEELDRELHVVKNEVKHINIRLDKQDVVLNDQSADIKTLLALANKSSGALWSLMGVSSTAGAVAAFVIEKWVAK